MRRLLEQLGPHSTGRACLYIKDMEKVDEDVVEQLISRSVAKINAAVARGFEGTTPA